jgi:CBS domain-containing membrane protein
MVIFVFVAGVAAMSIITITAFLTDLPLLFPPLGPSAFILFYTPMSKSACPRNVILSHSMAVVAGLFSVWCAGNIFPEANLTDMAVMNWCRVLAIASSIGIISILMVTVDCVHPPAAATALIAAMGYIENAVQVLGLIGAVALLVLEAVFLNRIIGGLPYPWWRFDPQAAKNFSQLAGLSTEKNTFWRQMTVKTFQRR